MKREKQIERREFLASIAGLTVAIATGRNIANGLEKKSTTSTMPKPNQREYNLREFLEKRIEQTYSIQPKQPEQTEKIYKVNYTSEDRERAIEALYAEARNVSDNPEYLRNVTSTFVTRALEKNKSISEVIGKNKAYSYLNKGDKNAVKSGNAKQIANSNSLEAQAYQVCEQIVDNILENGLKQDELYTHYFVRNKSSINFPEWAIGVTPDKVIEHKDKITRFYYLTPIEVAKKGIRHIFSTRV